MSAVLLGILWGVWIGVRTLLVGASLANLLFDWEDERD